MNRYALRHTGKAKRQLKMQTEGQPRNHQTFEEKQRAVPEGKNGGNEEEEIFKKQQNKTAYCQ